MTKNLLSCNIVILQLWFLLHFMWTTLLCVSQTSAGKNACAYCCMHYFYMTVKLTFIIDLKSTPVKTFPRRGKARGPGGKLRGLRFLIKSNKISNTKASNSQLLKFRQSKRAWKTMVKYWWSLWRTTLILQTGLWYVWCYLGGTCSSGKTSPRVRLHNTESFVWK